MDKKLAKDLLEFVANNSDYLIPSESFLYQRVICEMIKPMKKINATKVVAMEMKGLLYGPIIAHKLNLPFVPILKSGKIRSKKVKMVKGSSFVDYSKSRKAFEMFNNSVHGDKVILVDDWFQSGKTGKSTIKLIEKLGGKVVFISVIFDQTTSVDQIFFNKYNYHYLARVEK
jgi:adenine/guanine phosphoribosyltransferase-like PRPP-binding protein